jgi:processive 1,2-diacylglycerol beta-glucosyltransferase
MKIRYVIIGILFLASLNIDKKIHCAESKPFTKKKVLILTTFGGGGNYVASQAMETYLKDDYDVQLCHAFKEILSPLDPFSFFTSNTYSSEDFYNSFVPGHHFQLLGWIYGIGKLYIQSQKEKIRDLLRNYFLKVKPALIISVIPIINNIVLEVAQELNIPFILAPTDLDIEMYVHNIAKPTYKQFYLCLPFNDPDMMDPIVKAKIPMDFIHIIGAPLRPDFFAIKNKLALKKELEIKSPAHPILMLFMGSLGSDEIKEYVKRLLTITMPFNLIVCIGKNEQSKTDLERLSIPRHISMKIVGFTTRIADYMAISDLLITKSGTLSICEALYMSLPLFLDATSTLLPWEEFNHHFIKKHVFGLSIKKYDAVAPLISNVLQHPDELILYKRNIEKLPKKNFGQELMNLVKKILD